MIIKIGGSLFAPKHNDFFDREYLREMQILLSENYTSNIFLIH
jgi:isopentenyl phosphate kinase